MNKKRAIIAISSGIAAVVLIGIAYFGVNAAVNNPVRLLSLGERYLIEMDYEQAVVYFERLIKIEPKNARAYMGLAEAYDALGQTDKAIETLRFGLERTNDPAIAGYLATLEMRNSPVVAQVEEATPAPIPTAIIDTPTTEPTQEPTAAPIAIMETPTSESNEVSIRLSVEKITDEQLAIMVQSGEIPSDVKYLRLDANQITDINTLKGLTKLTQLHLHGNQIGDISALKELTNLAELMLLWNRISDISALKGLTNLMLLGAGNNQISDISVLENLSNLTRLSLYQNQIDDISPLKGLQNLIELDLAYNQISDISALQGLYKLQDLQLSYNQISDISALMGLTNLTSLRLTGNPITEEQIEELRLALPNCNISF